jgi:prepilin-type N-terminal cleavage/methylation domain-containing protein
MMSAHEMLTQPARGFTLMEILVAMVIMSVSLLSLLLLHSGTIQLAEAGRFTEMAPVLTRRVLAEQIAGLSNVTRSSGHFSPEFENIEWVCTVEDAALDGPVRLSELQPERFSKIEITLLDSGTGSAYSLTTWRYWVEPDE